MAVEANDNVMTVRAYLEGGVGNISVSDETLLWCLYQANARTYESKVTDEESGEISTITEKTTLETDVDLLTEKQRDLSLAWLYVSVAGYAASSGTISDKHPNWEHSEGSFRVTDAMRKFYKERADELFAKWDEPTMFSERWGFAGHGMRNPRRPTGRRL